jgi:hypothetical protein
MIDKQWNIAMLDIGNLHIGHSLSLYLNIDVPTIAV